MATSKKSELGKAVCDGKDEEFNEGFYKICCQSDKGEVEGHYVKIANSKVTADAALFDKEARLKIRTVPNENDELIMIIENENNEALAIEHDEVDNTFKICVKMNTALDKISKLKEAEHETNNFLFKKVPRWPGSEQFQITSNATVEGKHLTLAFNDKGKPMDPTKNHNEEGSFFRLVTNP